MYLMPQGNTEARLRECEQRLHALENMLNSLQLDNKPKRGRPPKEQDGHESTKGDSRI
jgi:hypothetical protein